MKNIQAGTYRVKILSLLKKKKKEWISDTKN